ncbi:MAG TPA: nodulation protein NfeD [Thermoanaerobaculia bacterium]|nr:nodulation protein NfeD [Thermoanaerobaculia bacterium]
MRLVFDTLGILGRRSPFPRRRLGPRRGRGEASAARAGLGASAAWRLTGAALLVLVGLAQPLLFASDEGGPATGEPGPLLHLRITSIISPVTSEVARGAIAQAEASGAQALVIELNTPGGLLESTREIFTAMLGADLPVVVFVAPQGAQAASAGFFLLMAADVAAMAPGTNTGAAHPVGGQGETIEGVLGEKVAQDAAASIRSLASRQGRNVELAESAVVESKSFTASEALENGLVDLIADDLEGLLEAIDGRTVTKHGREHVLRTRGAEPREIEMTAFQRLRSIIVHPNVAYVLLSLGGLGIYFELANPGAILPGVLGAICLILAFYALSVLPVNYAGVALLIVAAILFVLEITVTGFGLLAAGGVVALILGSTMLFKSADPAIRVSVQLIVGMAAVASAVVALMATLVVRVHRRRASTGREGMVSERGVARTDLAPHGKVSVHGEIWDAVADAPVGAGQPVEVVGVEGLLLRVQPAKQRTG